MNQYRVCLCFLAGLIATQVMAAEPPITIDCPAIRFDNWHRNKSVERNPTPVIVIAVGTLRNNLSSKKVRTELLVEKTLFGPQFDAIPLTKIDIPEKSEPMIYCLSFPERATEFELTISRQFEQHRIFPLAEMPALSAMAQVQMDGLVLGCESIFIGKPVDAQNGIKQRRTHQSSNGFETSSVTVKVIRRLNGSGPEKDETVQVSLKDPPPPGREFIYFANRGRDRVRDEGKKSGDVARFTAHRIWPASEVPRINEALKRQSLFPIQEATEEPGRKSRSRTITFQGSRAEAIALLGSTYDSARMLAMHRLMHEGEAAIPDVAIAVETNLFRKSLESLNSFEKQQHLIALLGVLENHRADGEIARLISLMLDKVQAGADFPAELPPHQDSNERRSGWYAELTADTNHSLAWLLLSLKERDAAVIFGKRLLKLRDLSAYRWLEELQYVVDHHHVEDQLELAALGPQMASLKPVEWRESAPIIRATFDDDGARLKTESDDGVVCTWDITNGNLIERSKAETTHPERVPRARDLVVLSEDRSVQFFFRRESRRGPYAPTSYTIEVGPPDELDAATPESSDAGPYFALDKSTELEGLFEVRRRSKRGRVESTNRRRNLGTVKLRFGQYEPIGIVPGGEYFHIGTQIFRRDDLSVVTAPNVTGRIEKICFSSDGSRYVVATNEGNGQPTMFFGLLGSRKTTPRVRVHETRTGKTLLAVDISSIGTPCVAITRNGDFVALCDRNGDVQVWPVPK